MLSAGVPSTEKMPTPRCSRRSGRFRLSEWLEALCSVSGAHTTTSKRVRSASRRSVTPCARYPSSLERSTKGRSAGLLIASPVYPKRAGRTTGRAARSAQATPPSPLFAPHEEAVSWNEHGGGGPQQYECAQSQAKPATARQDGGAHAPDRGAGALRRRG